MLSIAIPVADRTECAVALDVAFTLGSGLGAVVLGYHLRPGKSKHGDIPPSPGVVWARDTWPELSEENAEQLALSARKLFQQMAEQHGYEVGRKRGKGKTRRAVWKEVQGTPDKLMPLIGPVNDLLVVSRPRKDGGRKAWLVLMSALLDSGIPVLLLPQRAVSVPCKHVAIAWNRGAQEAHAVHAALPLLMQANQVSLISAGKDFRHGPSAAAMIDYLKSKGIKAAEHKVSGKGITGAALVQAAREAGADVLLSGAYTKGRLRQLLFGGVTEYLISNTSFPVIMMHS